MSVKIEIRPIQYADNRDIATIIRTTLIEFGGDKPGTAFKDKSVKDMYGAYQADKEVYFVALQQGELVGGCGIKQLQGGNPETCELQKMYLLPKARGLKIGKELLDKCIDFAVKSGYKQCYLETFPYMYAAIRLYKKNSFYPINEAMGNTGHTACDVWMLKDLIDSQGENRKGGMVSYPDALRRNLGFRACPEVKYHLLKI